MIRVAHLADSHLDERDDLEDNVRVHLAAVEAIREAKPDVVVHAGDLHNRKSSPEVREAAREILAALAEVAPVVLVRGNHDAEGDLRIYGALRTKCRVHVAERPGFLWILSAGLVVFVLPWPEKVFLATKAGEGIEGTNARANAALRAILGGVRAKVAAWAREKVSIGVGHVMVGGSRLSTGQTLIGDAVEVAPADLAETGAVVWALGHIHAPQSFPGSVFYSGSPQRLTFGEPEAKGLRLYEIERDREAPGGGRLLRSEWVELPARRIELLEEDWTDDLARAALRAASTEDLLARAFSLGPTFGDYQGARVRLRYRIAPEDVGLVNERALEEAFRRRGAVDVKLEAVLVHETRIRSEAAAAASSTWEAVAAYLEAKRVEVDETRGAELRRKVEDLEGRAA
jgi:exonuclease SbcD